MKLLEHTEYRADGRHFLTSGNMALRALAKIVCSSAAPLTQLPPTFLFPCRRYLSNVTTTTASSDPGPPPGSYIASSRSRPAEDSTSSEHATPTIDYNSDRRHPQLSRHSHSQIPARPLTESLPLLASLAAQAPHYITAHIHARPYLLTEGDSVRLPFLMPNAPVGTRLRLNRAGILGSRDFTFKGYPWVDEKYFVCRAIVTGIEQEPERVKVKTKQRQRRVKRIKSQHSYTTLSITELRILPDEEDSLAEAENEELDELQ